MQTVSIGDSLLEMSNSVFWGKKKKNIYQNVVLKFLPGMQGIKIFMILALQVVGFYSNLFDIVLTKNTPPPHHTHTMCMYSSR